MTERLPCPNADQPTATCHDHDTRPPLKRYTRHPSTCGKWWHHQIEGSYLKAERACTCGLEAWVAGLEAVAEALERIARGPTSLAATWLALASAREWSAHIRGEQG